MCGDNMRYTISSLFLSIYIIIIYMLLTRHATIADYLTTIRRLFRDCPTTIPGTAGELRGNLRAVPERASRSSGREAWRQERRSGSGRRWHGGQQTAPRICERGRERGRRYQGGAGNVSICAGIAL